MTKTPFLGPVTPARATFACARVAAANLRGKPADLEMPARAYCGGDFVARLLNDFSGGQRPRPRG